ncbi:hypothetical protein CEE44_03185 [Candidatus Woesearchaeota archaeon B3_Woes]|nr:MAG: hypothetical protein CEE44_03185 [Candidatus Woesearchaeota archaeon B3_Woes]
MMKIRISWHKLKSILGLSLQLAKAGFKLRNEGSYLGILWYLLDPLLMFVILLSIRNIVGVDIENYPLYLLLGLIMFNFFRKTTSESTGVMIGNAGLIKSVNINHEVFVVSTVFKNIFSHFFEILLLILLLILFNISPINVIFYPLIFAFFSFFVLGVSFVVSTIGTYFVDFARFWNVVTRVLWFATPIFYGANLDLPFNFNSLNPMYYFIKIARKIIIYNQIPRLWMIFGAILFSFILFFFGMFIFEKYKHKFAELV